MCDDLTIVISNIYQKSSADSHSHQRHSHVQYKTHDPTLLQLASHAYSVKSMALHCFLMAGLGFLMHFCGGLSRLIHSLAYIMKKSDRYAWKHEKLVSYFNNLRECL